MDIEKIMEELNRRFAEPLPEFYKRRIIVWRDEDREFEDRLSEISLSNAKTAALTETNFFATKKLLCADDTTGNYLLYCPITFESQEDNWLLDIELYSEEFRADMISMWMDEMGVPSTPWLRKSFKTYRKFFNVKERRRAAAALHGSLENPRQLEAGDWILRGDGGPGPFRHTYAADGGDPTLRQEFLAGLEDRISSAHQAYCYDLVSDWLHEDAGTLREVAEFVETEARLPGRFMKLQAGDLLEVELFPCVNEIILIKLMTEIGEGVIDVEAITRAVEKRRACAWFEDSKDYYEGLLQAARMQEFFQKHSGGFHSVEPKRVWREYMEEYYVMDSYYRLFHLSFAKSLKSWHRELSDPFRVVADKVEGLYANWFLGELGKNWTDACADDLREHGCVEGVPRQAVFYAEKVAPLDVKVYVIVSDAMRYEVGVSLAEQLRRETRGEVKLTAVQAQFPTVTKFGMAALLPHKRLSVELKPDGLAVLADGQSTESGARDKLLKAANEKSVALRYKDLIGMKRADRQALVKEMEVVYIYPESRIIV